MMKKVWMFLNFKIMVIYACPVLFFNFLEYFDGVQDLSLTEICK